VPVNVMADVLVELHIIWLLTGEVLGIGFTVTVCITVPHPEI